MAKKHDITNCGIVVFFDRQFVKLEVCVGGMPRIFAGQR
jgi:hypothetical protein